MQLQLSTMEQRASTDLSMHARQKSNQMKVTLDQKDLLIKSLGEEVKHLRARLADCQSIPKEDSI